MDILPTSVISTIEFSLEIFIVIAASIILAFNYFHGKEARKMERKLNISLPGSVSLALNFQMILSFVFFATALVFLFLI